MRRYIPNLLTLSRFPLAALMLYLHFSGYYITTLCVWLWASLTDGLDGYFARAWGCESRFGESVDPYADKTLCWAMVVIVATITYDSIFFAIAIVPVIVVIALYDVGLGIIRYRWERAPVPTNRFAKWKTTLLIMSLTVFYFGILFPSQDITIGYIGTAFASAAWLCAVASAFYYLESYMQAQGR